MFLEWNSLSKLYDVLEQSPKNLITRLKKFPK